MKHLHSSTLTAAVLLAALLCSVSCASSDTNTPAVDTAAGDAQTTTAVSEDNYPYEKSDLGGYTLRVLNIDDLWDMFVKIDTEATDGEVLNDAIYNRNRKAENDLNFNLEEIRLSSDIKENNNYIKDAVLANDDVYDITYAGIYDTPALLTEGYMMNLLDIDGLNLHEAWWDNTVCESALINDCLYIATSPMQMMSYDSAWVLFFNETIMNANDLEHPYNLVRDGKWTLDALNTYTKAVANLNGDANFNWDSNGNAFYGISCHPYAPKHFLNSADAHTVINDEDGNLIFNADSVHFMNAVSALSQSLSTKSGMAIEASTTDFDVEAGGYMHIFTTGRSLFLTAEIKAAQLMRDMEATFGLVPIPKLDENQKSYYADFVQSCVYYTVPVTNSHLRETAVASDYISYLGWRDVLPIYYSNVVEQKGLRNEESIEMLEIVLSSKTVDLAVMFGWAGTLFDNIESKIFSGSDAVASIIERNQKKIETAIDATLEAIENTKSNS